MSFDFRDYRYDFENIIDDECADIKSDMSYAAENVLSDYFNHCFYDRVGEIVESAYNDGYEKAEEECRTLCYDEAYDKGYDAGFKAAWASMRKALSDWFEGLAVEPVTTWEAEETCPYCNHLGHYSVPYGTYKAHCENCGKEIMLCNLCDFHSDCNECPHR